MAIIVEDNSYGPNSAAYFQKYLGKGGFVLSSPRQTEDSQSSSEESDRIVEEAKAFGRKLFDEASPASGYEKPSPSEKTEE